MPFRKTYRPSRVKQLEQRAERNGFTSHFVDPHQDYFYRGTWKNNKKTGYGYMIFRKEMFCYEGYFENDLFHGFGRLGKLLQDGTSEVIYEGYWAHGKMEGLGRWVLPHSKEERACNPPRNPRTELPEMKIDPFEGSKSFQTDRENENETDSCTYDFIYNKLSEKIYIPKNHFDLASYWNNNNDDVGGHLAMSDVNISCCYSYDVEQSFQSSGDFQQSQCTSSKETSSESSGEKVSLRENLFNAPAFDPTKPTLATNNECISFQELKQIYKEFQNLVREEKKNDTWDEFVNDAQFQVRPDPEQERIDYEQPNFTDFRADCPKGIFYQNINGEKIAIRRDEITHDILHDIEKLKSKKTLGLKTIDEAKLKFYLYDGMMKDNLPNGYGYACFPEDIYYYGNWKNGKFHGKGILMSWNEYSFEGQFENGVRSGHGVYINYQNGYLQRGFWAKGSFIESSVEISYRRQSAIYPVIFPIPDLKICVDTAEDVTSWNSEDASFNCHGVIS